MNKRNRIGAASALLIGMSFVVPTIAFAQISQDKLMIRLLDTVARQSLKGYTRPNNVKPRIGTLEQGNQIEMSFRLRKGQKYGFTAVCDVNCNDIDLNLKDADGQVIDEDNGEEETAVVAYTAEETSVYELTVSMPSCDQAECAYAIGVYKR